MIIQKRRNILFIASATLALSVWTCGVQAEGVSRGALLASMCDTCHGTNGEGSDPIPAIAGKDADTIVSLLKSFAAGEADITIMDRHAKGYTDEELQAIAEHYAGL